MKKIILLIMSFISLDLLAYTGTVKFVTNGISINGSKPEKETCEFKFENTPNALAHCLVERSKAGAIECPIDFRLANIVKACLTLTNSEESDLDNAYYRVYDENGNLIYDADE
ncbi:TPA: hypothetical protein ACK3JR_000534 [Mannheimia haemolytica]